MDTVTCKTIIDPNFTNNDVGLVGGMSNIFGETTITTSLVGAKPSEISEVKDLRIKVIKLEQENKYLKDTIDYLLKQIDEQRS